MVYLVMQSVVLISFPTNHLYFTPNYIKLSMRICYIHTMSFGEGLSPQLSMFWLDVHLQKPQHSDIMNSGICSYCHYNSQYLAKEQRFVP